MGQSSYEPQIILRGGPTKEIIIMRHLSAPQIGQLTRHEVELTEVWFLNAKLSNGKH